MLAACLAHYSYSEILADSSFILTFASKITLAGERKCVKLFSGFEKTPVGMIHATSAHISLNKVSHTTVLNVILYIISFFCILP